MQSKLGLKPIARSRTGAEYGTGPVMLHEVEGLPEGQKISIRNVRPEGQEPIWQIGAHFKGRETRWAGTFESADEALAELQEQLDSADEEITG
jgi:heme-degrading monooxygenase HmoA